MAWAVPVLTVPVKLLVLGCGRLMEKAQMQVLLLGLSGGVTGPSPGLHGRQRLAHLGRGHQSCVVTPWTAACSCLLQARLGRGRGSADVWDRSPGQGSACLPQAASEHLPPCQSQRQAGDFSSGVLQAAQSLPAAPSREPHRPQRHTAAPPRGASSSAPPKLCFTMPGLGGTCLGTDVPC